MERKYYEAYEDRYQKIHAIGLQWFDDAPSEIVLQTAIKYSVSSAAPVLELGCGEGRDAYLMLDKGYNLLATDISPEAINYCKEKFPRYSQRFQILDCISGRINRKFDFIYAVAVIHMLVQENDREAFYRFIYHHLSDHGVALICSMGDGVMEHSTNIRSAFELQNRVHEKSGRQVQIANTSCRMVTFDTWHKELERASLSVLEEGITSAPPDFPFMMYAIVKR